MDGKWSVSQLTFFPDLFFSDFKDFSDLFCKNENLLIDIDSDLGLTDLQDFVRNDLSDLSDLICNCEIIWFIYQNGVSI